MSTSRDIKQYGYPQLQLEAAFIQLNSLEEGVHLEEIVNNLSALEQKFDAAGIPTAEDMPPQQPLFSSGNPTNIRTASAELPLAPTDEMSISTPSDLPKKVRGMNDNKPASPVSAPDLNRSSSPPRPRVTRSLAEVPSFWDELKSKLPMKLGHGLLAKSVPSVNAANVVEIPCSPSDLAIVKDSDKKIIADTLTQMVGEPVKIALVQLDTVSVSTMAEDAPEKPAQKTPLVRMAEAQDDPQLKTALELFDATILETQ